MSDKARRRARIVETLSHQPVRSQEALRELLERHGIEVTQGALSRDLRELGVVKTPAGYALPGAASIQTRAPAGPAALKGLGPGLGRAAGDFLLSAVPSGQLVVVKTSPGRAGALTAELDAAGLEGVVGTIAGDDTIFVATHSDRAARALVRRLLELAGVS